MDVTMNPNRTAPWRNIVLVTGGMWLVFFAYCRLMAPWIEGQSAGQVPEIDLLGALRVEHAEQWITLFPQDAWQRDEANRNIVRANGNILLFQDYENQADGTLRVAGLCLLLFDQNSTVKELPAGQAATTAHSDSGRAFPTVIEAMDDALLTFENVGGGGLGHYGDLKQIQFTGRVHFWRSGPRPADAFLLETEQLTITGSQAHTDAALRFRFGDSWGRATGLHLMFDNPESLHSSRATLTKIQGLRHLRMNQMEHLSLDGDQLVLSCQGPAEFSVPRQVARLFRSVRAQRVAEDQWLAAEAMQVEFYSSDQPPPRLASDLSPPAPSSPDSDRGSVQAADSRGPASHWLPQGLKARRLLAYGSPAQVIGLQRQAIEAARQPAAEATVDDLLDQEPNSLAWRLAAAVLQYDLEPQEFWAGDLPRQAPEAWMWEAVETAPSGVDFHRDQLRLQVPQLTYRLGGDTASGLQPDREPPGDGPSPPALAGLGDSSPGQLIAPGPGTLWVGGGDDRDPVRARWQDQLRAAPDPELPDRFLISLYGDSQIDLDDQSWVRADVIHQWLKQVEPTADGQGDGSQWQPDLVLAEGRVRYRDSSLAADLQEARIFFPTTDFGHLHQGDEVAAIEQPVAALLPDSTTPSSVAVPGMANPSPRQDPGRALPNPNPIHNPNRTDNDSMVRNLESDKKTLSRVQAGQLIVQLDWQPTPISPAGPGESGSTEFDRDRDGFERLPSANNRPGERSQRNLATTTSSRYLVKTVELLDEVEIWESTADDPPAVISPVERDIALLAASDPASLLAAEHTGRGEARPSRYRLKGQRVVGIAQPDARTSQPGAAGSLGFTDTVGNREPTKTAFQWSIFGDQTPAEVVTMEAALRSSELHFDQAAHLVWSSQPGHLDFRSAPRGDAGGPGAGVADPSLSGQGQAWWSESLRFDGRVGVLDGQVRVVMEEVVADGSQHHTQAWGDQLRIELSESVSFQTGNSGASRPTAQRLVLSQVLEPSERENIEERQAEEAMTLSQAGQPRTEPTDGRVRVEHRRHRPDGSLLSRDQIWSPQVDWDQRQDSVIAAGPGRLASLRGSTEARPMPAAQVGGGQAKAEWTLVQVDFGRQLDGRLNAGRFLFSGPVAALYGQADDWQAAEDPRRLRDPFRLTSDTLTIDRWQASPSSEYEVEMEARGRVHVWGQDFEGLAQRINFAQQQDLLTMQGDARSPARFWRSGAAPQQRDHLSAQKIWYRPQSQDFRFEGFQEGNLNIFSDRRP